jgi:hypothetical protein
LPCLSISASKSASGSPNAFVTSSNCLQQIDDRLHGLLDDLAHRLVRVELRLLLQQAAGVALREHGLAEVAFVGAGHDAQQRALARAVEAEHADLCAVVKAERDVAQHLPVRRMHAAHANHGIDDLLGFRHGRLLNI